MPKELAIIGSGSAALGYLNAARKKILSDKEKAKDLKLVVFERSAIAGSGAPYDKSIISPEHLFNVQTVSSNISSIGLDGREGLDGSSFFNWLQEDQAKTFLRKEFEEIFSSRFKRAFKRRFGEFDEALLVEKNIFDPSFQETEFYKQNQGREGFASMLKYHQEKFSSYAKEVEENAKNPAGFLPRIVYGFYSKALFDYQVKSLRELGVEVEVKCQAEVVAIKQQEEKLSITTKSGIAQQFDHAFVATGLWQEEKTPHKNPNYVQNIWPANNVENLVEEAVAKAKAQGKTSIRIGILGTSLSAYDMVRTCFKDGMTVDGVEIHIDMCSRNGRLQGVKDGFDWLPESLEKHMPQALKKAMASKGLQYEEDGRMNFWGNLTANFMKIIEGEKQKNLPQKDRIYLYQMVAVFLEILQAAYKNSGDKEKATFTESVKNQVLENKENYKTTLDLLRGVDNPDQFVVLQSNFEASKDENIYLQIFNLFTESASYFKYLPKDEQIFYRKFSREFFGPYWAPMPSQTAQDLLACHKASHLEIRKLGRDSKYEIPDEGAIKITDSQGVVVEYDMMINTSKAKLTKYTTSDLYQAIKENFKDPLAPPTIEMKVERDFAEFFKAKYGEEYGSEILKSCAVSQDGDEFTLKFAGDVLSTLKQDPSRPSFSFSVSREVGGVASATRAGEQAFNAIFQ